MEILTEWVQVLGTNIIYIILMFGIWMALTAIYVPGTGFPEGLALVALAVGGVGSILLSANIIGMILLIVALGCFLALLKYSEQWLLVVIGGVLQLTGSIFLFGGENRVSIWVILLVNAAALAYHEIILRPGLMIQNKPRMLDDETLIGSTGEVVSSLNPMGTVRVQGELWRARSEQSLEKGTEIRVTARKGLELVVEALAGGE